MPAPQRERYNAKARGSVAGGSSHKKRKRLTTRPRGEDGEAGDESVVKDVQVGTAGRLAADNGLEIGSGMSSKKKKRLDSYIAKKLKTEARLKTLQRLAALAPTTSTSASLLSSSTLGQNPLAPTSAKERLEQREDRLVRRGIERMQRRGLAGDSDEDGESGSEHVSEEEGMSARRKGKERAVEVVEDVGGLMLAASEGATLAAHAVSKNAKPKKSKKANWNPNFLPTQPQSDLSDFDSSDSDYDSPPEAGPSSCPASPQDPPFAEATPQSPQSGGDVQPAREKAAPTKPPNPIIAMGVGGALKRSADGAVVQPRVVVRGRGRKPFLGRRRAMQVEQDEDDEDDESGEDEDDDDDDDGVMEKDAEDDSEDGDRSDRGGSEKDDEESEDGEDDDDGEPPPPTKKRALGFKEWALKQMGQSAPPDVLHTTSSSDTAAKAPSVPKSIASDRPKTTEPFLGPLGATLAIPSSSLLDQNKLSTISSESVAARPKITRRPSVAAARMDLPILAEEQPIIEAIRMFPVVVICGETGSGKTTQVPQMLYEAGFGFKGGDNPGMIAITQPRRVAAVSLATRVSSELNLPPSSSVVAHQIRYSSTTSPDTAIKFMTDGVLLRELATDFLLSRYSVIVVDEAHERGVNTDVLIGVLSRVGKLREKRWRESTATQATTAPGFSSSRVGPLRIVIMSATLRVSDFTSNPTLFPTPPPVIHIAARQHPVTIHFNRHTVGDYVAEAYKKVCKIHARLPPGGVLVFLTGQSEIQALCRKLEKKYGNKGEALGKGPIGKTEWGKERRKEVILELPAEDREAEDVELGNDEDLAADVDDGEAESDPEALDSDEDETLHVPELDEASDVPMHVLPLYSLLPNDQQMLVFRRPPEGHRLVIVSTNVAETSLTIPGIRYVIDSGRAKERAYDHSSGVQSFKVGWISKASASQRAGRAGRTGPGHCYRLYSSALFEDHFPQFSQPELLRMPIEGVVLQMKAMAIDQVVNFPFPTPPDRRALRKAEELLTHLGALEQATSTRMVAGVQQAGSAGGRITVLGKAMASYPVSPRFAKMLAIGSQHGCLPYVVAIVAALSVGDPFIHEQSVNAAYDDDDDDDEDNVDGAQRRTERKAELAGIRSDDIRAKEERKDARRTFFAAQSSFNALGNGASDMFKLLAAVGAFEYDPSPEFCEKNFLRPKAMQEIHQLRSQLSSIAKLPPSQSSTLSPPADVQLKVIRQILTSAFIDSVAVRLDIALHKSSSGSSAFTSCRNVPYRATGLPPGTEVFIHPSSSMFHHAPPDFVVFAEITQSQSRSGEGEGKRWMKGVTRINPGWLASLGKGLCTFSTPREMPGKGKSGNGIGIAAMGGKEDERDVVVVPHFRDLGVDLPAVRRKQRRKGTRWVLVE